MQTKIAVVDTGADTFSSWISKTNQTINAISNVAVVVIANSTGDAVTGNGFVVGILGANTLVCTNIRGGNVGTAGTLNVTSNAVFSGDVSFGGAAITGNSVTTTGTSQQVIDSWLINTYRAAKYVLSIKNNSANGYSATEIMVLQDDGTAYVTEYAVLNSNGSLGTFAVDANSTAARLLFTPSPANTTVKYSRQLFGV